MRKILITGGAGFIGSALVRYIINETSDAVVVVDTLTYAGNLMSLAPVAQSERFAFEKVDICDRAELARVFTEYQPDCVMHLAAESHVDRSIDGPAAFIETNIVGTYTLLEAARAYWTALTEDKNQRSVFIISPPTKYMVTCTRRMILHRNHAVCAEQPLFRVKSQQRPSGARLAADLWSADAYHQLLE